MIRIGLRAVALVSMLALVLTVDGARAAAEHGGELDPSEDNGAAGRDNGFNGPQVTPAEACDGQPAPSGSRVERRLPDGPRLADGSLAFVSGVCVYLPPGYDGDLRYPVVYLLHGGGGDHSDWMQNGGLREIVDDAVAADPAAAAIVVMPDGDEPAAWYDRIDGAFLGETYVNDHLVPFIDEEYRTIADRSGRAVVGLSNGGYGALHLAAKRPDLYSVAGSMSGNVAYRATENGGFGDPLADAPFGDGQRPVSLIPNLDHVDLILDLGTECIDDVVVDACVTHTFDQLFLPDNTDLVTRLRAREGRGVVDVGWPEQGGHAWRWWSRWFRERQFPFVLARLDDPVAVPDPAPSTPPTFDHRSVWPTFEVWGLRVEVERDARWEWLDLVDVSANRMQIAGSGIATITTPPDHRAGATYAVDGAVEPSVTADDAGRLTFDVDLGSDELATVTIEAVDAGGAVSGRAVPDGPDTGGKLPATGTSTDWLLVMAVGLAGVLCVVLVTRRRRSR
ncbi:alpha/beta hydrolase [Actinospongicola halichondriae]|uniref:alpha/beta hydrolase n=1 Tax=Actinospongicola halichondriae TaxID=3236844 RepID=UPI003D3B5303